MTPVPIMMTIPNLDTAGSGKAMLNVLACIDRDRFTPIVCVSRPGGPFTDRLRDLDIELIVAPTTVAARPLTKLATTVGDAAGPLRGRAQLWHSYHYLDDYTEAMVARAAGARWCFTKKNMSWNRRSWFVRSSLAHGIAAQNHDQISLLHQVPGLSGRLRHIPRGVPIPETGRPETPAGERARIRSELAIPGNGPVVTCVANLVARKQQQDLIAAVGQLNERNAARGIPETVTLILAGREVEAGHTAMVRVEIEQRQMADQVVLLGEIRNVDDLLRTSDAFCLPTGPAGEGCPVALLEAMALGVPSVATNVPGSREVIDETSGWMVDHSRPDQLATALSEALGPDGGDRGEGGRQRVRAKFSIAQEAENHEAMWTGVLDRPELVTRVRRHARRGVASARFVTEHPLTCDEPAKALGRWAGFNLRQAVRPNPEWIDFVNGTRLEIERGRGGSVSNLYTHLADPEEMALLAHVLRSGHLFCDVGANVGAYTVLAAACGARVAAFEPGSDAREVLTRHVDTNGLSHLVQIHSEVVGAHQGVVRLTVGQDSLNHVATDADTSSPSTEVAMVTLDAAITQPVTAMKIDVEGFEAEVLDGASNHLASPALEVIVIELNRSGHRYGVDDAEVRQRLEQQGFSEVSYDPFSRTVGHPGPRRNGMHNTIWTRNADRLETLVQGAPPLEAGPWSL